MRVGIGLSRSKDIQKALQEAYRQSLQRLQALKADFVLFTYTYDHALDPEIFSSLLKRVWKNVDHVGFSTWSAWSEDEQFEADSGLMVLSFLLPSEKKEILKVHSLKEKADLWAAELVRRLEDCEAHRDETGVLLFVADSIHFQPGKGLDRLSQAFSNIQVIGFGTSYGIPQCSLIVNGEIYSNSLVGVYFHGLETWAGILQHIQPEARPININRMSENLVIEIDGRPAFYRLTEHLMEEDDLPMMSPDEFRKHMGNMYLVEKAKGDTKSLRILGEAHRVIPLLGSEMTTGMVAIGEPLDFEKEQYLGQKKQKYAESRAREVLKELQNKVPNPKALLVFSASSRSRDPIRTLSDSALIKEYFPDIPIFAVSTQGEYIQEINQHSAIILALP